MRYYDQYQELYHSDDEWYFEYVNRELDKIKRRYKNECRRTKKRSE